MIHKLNHNSDVTANQIHRVFQQSYQIEADLVGVTNFPPLLRTSDDIQQSTTSFFGFHEQNDLAAVIEITTSDNKLHINSLTVLPKYFRRGIASKLMDFVLLSNDFDRATVETAVVNQPAITLYEKHGFIEYKQYVPDHGIPKIALALQPLV